MRIPRLLLATIATLTIMATAPARADTKLYNEVTLSDLEDIFRDLGLKTKDNSTPELTTLQIWQNGEGGINYSVNLYDCRGAQRYAFCKQLQFRAGWTIEKPVPLATLNDFADKWVFGRPLLHGKDLWIEYAITIDGGVTRDNLKKQIAIFDSQIDTFRKHFKDFEL